MEELTFWLLDLNYDTAPSRPEMWLWGITREGERVLVIDANSTPVFYLIPESDSDLARGIHTVLQNGKKRKDFVHAAVVERMWEGRCRPVIEVQTTAVDTVSMGRLARALTKGTNIKTVAGDDLRWSVQYLLYNQLTTSAWWTVPIQTVSESSVKLLPSTRIQIYRIPEGEKPVCSSEQPAIPPVRTMVWAALPWHPEGLMIPERDPVVILGFYDGKQIRLFYGDDETALLKDFVAAWQGIDPDVIFGFDVNRHTWPYLLERYRIHAISAAFGRDGSTPHTSLFGHISITGRAGIDLLDFAQEIPEIKLPNLIEAARYLRLDATCEEWDDWTWARCWAEDRDTAVAWFEERLRVLGSVAGEFWPYAAGLSRLTGIPLDHVATTAAGFRVDQVLLRAAMKRDEIPPRRKEQPYYAYAGGYVIQPQPGIHENVAVLDFKSMYPSIMMLYNVSPDTYVPPDITVEPDEVYSAPTTGHRFRRTPDGLYRMVLKQLLAARERLKEKRATLAANEPEARILAAEEKAVKVITNAVYGYAGWPGARWYARAVAEACADWGRWIIQKTLHQARVLGLEVIYGDTDSLFVRYDPHRVGNLVEWVTRELKMTIELEKVYQRILFTEAKKRYAGWTTDGRLEMVGLEAVRGDWAPIVQDVQERVLGTLLRDADPHKARKELEATVEALRQRKVDWRKLVIWKALTRRIEDYKAMTPHVAAAKMLMEKGHRIPIGYKVGYVVLLGKGALYKRIAPYPYVPKEQIDVEYYISKQVRPAVERILSVAH